MIPTREFIAPIFGEFVTWLESELRKGEKTIVGFRDDERTSPVAIYLRKRDEYTLEGERYRRVPWTVGKRGPYGMILWPFIAVKLPPEFFRFTAALPKKSRAEVWAEEACQIARKIAEELPKEEQKTA